ncbi:LysM domain-containing protein [Penicillium rolfsii]|nr:LysM domain-containing protein [Penicillium rolfsii]
MPNLKLAMALSLLPELLAARGVPLVRRSVDCTFSIVASPGDSCASFASSWGLSVDGFKSLNPNVDCAKFDDNAEYCVIGSVTPSKPSSTSSTTTTTTTQKTTTTTTQKPTTTTTQMATTTAISTKTTTSSATESSASALPTQPGLVANCDKFHEVASGDQCDTIEARYGITHNQFSSWNPYIDSGCSNLWLGYYVCVHVPGASSTTSQPAPAQTSSAPPTGSDVPSPTQPGIDANCDQYHKVVSGDQCGTIESEYGISHTDFTVWNPSINAIVAPGCSNLWLDYYVCVHVKPEPPMPNLAADCKKYHKVQSGEGCYDIDSAYGITLDQFLKWNPSVNPSCSNLWLGYYVCVGV